MTTPYMAGSGTLVRAAGMVNTAHDDFNRLSATLSDQLSNLTAQWQGQGGTAFFNLQTAWTEKQRTIVAALLEFERALQGTDRINVSNDEEVGSAGNTLTGRLGEIPTSVGPSA